MSVTEATLFTITALFLDASGHTTLTIKSVPADKVWECSEWLGRMGAVAATIEMQDSITTLHDAAANNGQYVQ